MPKPDYTVTEWIDVPTERGPLRCWVGRPVKDATEPPPHLDLAYQVPPVATARFPALVVVFEVYGLADAVQNVCHQLAKEGYLAVAPDLYCRDAAWQEIDTWDVERGRASIRSSDPAVQEQSIAALPEAYHPGARRAAAWLGGHDTSTYNPDIHAVVDYLKTRPDVDPERVGAIGFCMGGGQVGTLATQRDDLSVAVIYYGAPPRTELVPKITAPMMAHYGALDDLARRAPEFEQAMKEHGKELSLHIYEGAPHRFFNDTRPFYQEAPAKLSWERTLAFLRKYLGDRD
jgi:carboxymethylenebutenolidase